MKKECPKFKVWLEKKGTNLCDLIPSVCFESNFVEICHDTWWIDSGAEIHISNTMQGFIRKRKPIGSELSIYMGNRMRSRMEAIGTFRLVLSTGCILDLEKKLYFRFFSKFDFFILACKTRIMYRFL